MSRKLFTCHGGHIILPSSVLVSRQMEGILGNSAEGSLGEKRVNPRRIDTVVFLSDSHRQSHAGCPASTAGRMYQLF